MRFTTAPILISTATGDGRLTSSPPPRGSKEAFQTSAKDPRAYYSAPDVRVEFKFGDYRLGGSNMPLSLPWAKGKSATVESVERNALTLKMDTGEKVVAGRAGLVVATERDSVTVAHNDGSVTIYSGLKSVSAKLGSQVQAGQELGAAGEEPVGFQVAVPDQGMNYRALPANFTVSGNTIFNRNGTLNGTKLCDPTNVVKPVPSDDEIIAMGLHAIR